MAGLMEVNPLAVQQGQKDKSGKSGGVGKDVDFNAFLGAAEAFAPTATTAGSMYGDRSSSAVLGAAFSGVTSMRQQTAGGTSAGYTPSFAGGYGGSDPLLTSMGSGVGGGIAKTGSIGDPNGPVIAGVDGFNRSDLIGSLQQNSMQLLEMQALLQTHMQEANVKSNILSADHRARMAMIEKFSARG